MLLSLAQWLQATSPFTAVRMSWYVYPAVLTLHLVGISLLGGMILMTNLRLLDVALRKWQVSDMIDRLRTPKRLGFLLVAVCGILLAGSKAEEYYYNYFFWIKMSLLVLIAIHAMIFRGSVYNKATELDRAATVPGQAKLAAGLSLLLWAGVACAGRGIGYIDAPLEKLHAEVHAILHR
jgi:hypothetical protein